MRIGDAVSIYTSSCSSENVSVILFSRAEICFCSILCSYIFFSSAFTGVLENQLAHAPEDFFIDPLSQNNFLVADLKSFFELTRDTALPNSLRLAARELQQMVEKRFKTSLAVEELGGDGDDAPVIVEL